ncbi:MAG: hypothetical protein NXI32_11035 [bacterium]|nr:hypothetical protein [bacterium]
MQRWHDLQNNKELEHDCQKLLNDLANIAAEASRCLDSAESRQASLSIVESKLAELLVRTFEIADVAECCVLETMVEFIKAERQKAS